MNVTLMFTLLLYSVNFFFFNAPLCPPTNCLLCLLFDARQIANSRFICELAAAGGGGNDANVRQPKQ